MGIVGVVIGLIAVLQGAAWLGPRRGPPRGLLGATLTSAGLLLIGASLLYALAPGFY